MKRLLSPSWPLVFPLILLLNLDAFATAPTAPTVEPARTPDSKPSAEQLKASEWAASLSLTNAAKIERVAFLIATHLSAVRDWHDAHPFTTVPAGINPATGNRLTDLDRQIIADSAMPRSTHETLMNGLRQDLTEPQVEAVLDKYTVGKVAFTLKGYRAIVPDLTSAEEAKILEFLKQAREQAVDYRTMKEISAIFEIYKTKCEQHLISNGRNWRQLYKAYTDSIKARKAENTKATTPAP